MLRPEWWGHLWNLLIIKLWIKFRKWWRNSEQETWCRAIGKAACSDAKGAAPSSGQIQQLHKWSLQPGELRAPNIHRYPREKRMTPLN